MSQLVMNKIIRHSLVCLFAFCVTFQVLAFDKRQYVEIELESLLEKSVAVVTSQSQESDVRFIPQPNKYSVRAQVHKMPYICEPELLLESLKAAHYIPDNATSSAIPSITYCMDLITVDEVVVTSYLQDEVKEHVFNEVVSGDKITLFVIWLYVREETQLPQILTLDFFR